MKSSDEETKSRIINATAELMDEKENVQKITVRDIAARAGVGTGSINYHFQSKDKLINETVQFISSKNIKALLEEIEKIEVPPFEKIMIIMKIIADKMAENAAFAKISMHNELFNQYGLEDTSLIFHTFMFKLAREIYGDSKSDKELHIMLHQFGSSLQTAFMRSDRFRDHFGIDFFNNEQRNELVELLVKNIIKEVNK